MLTYCSKVYILPSIGNTDTFGQDIKNNKEDLIGISQIRLRVRDKNCHSFCV